jgi:hypothetical protein
MRNLIKKIKPASGLKYFFTGLASVVNSLAGVVNY